MYRWTSHERTVRNGRPLRGNIHLENVIRNADGELPKVKIAENLTEPEAFALERFWIDAIGREVHGGPLINQTDGGEGISGLKMSAETVSKLRARRHSEETKQKLRAAKANVTAETRAKMSAARKGRKESRESIEKRAAKLRGRKRPAEVGAKVSASKMGKKATDATKTALRAGNRSRDPDVRAKISAGLRRAFANGVKK